jgi:dolichol kinase
VLFFCLKYYIISALTEHRLQLFEKENIIEPSARTVIARVLGLFAACMAASAYASTVSLLVVLVLIGVTFLTGLTDLVTAKYSMAAISGLAFGAGLASLCGWATPAMIG